MRQRHVYVVVSVRNRRRLTLQCLDKLEGQTWSELTVVVVDDGSTDGTREDIRRLYPTVQLLEGDGTLWWAGATNRGVAWCLKRASASDFVLTLNDDTVFEADYVELLVRTADRRLGSLVGSVVVDARDRQTVLDGGVTVNWFTAREAQPIRGRFLCELRESSRRAVSVDVLSGRGTLIPVEVYRRVGLYDERHLPHYAADYELSRRAARAGYGLLIDFDAVVYSVVDDRPVASVPSQSTWSRIKAILASKNSPRNPRYHLVYARLVCPWYALPFYVSCYFIRLFGTPLTRRIRVLIQSAGGAG